MPSITLLINKFRIQYPGIAFVPDEEFRWSPKDRAIFYKQGSDDVSALLHELAHALLNHSNFKRDTVLIELERDAWNYAKHTLGPQYKIVIDDDVIDAATDTYRDWLHARSTCPTCQSTGLQVKVAAYKCIACHTSWQVNDARTNSLRRTKIPLK